MHKFNLFVLFFISSVVCFILVISGQAIIKSVAIASASTSSQQSQDPRNLKALIVNSNTNGSSSHEMILYSYSTDEGNHLTGLSFPSKARMSMTTSSFIKITSANPTFKVIATEITLYNDSNNDNPLYLNPAADGHWFVNLPPGIYRLQANSEYTPSNDDVATFVETVQILGTSVKTSEESQVTTSPSNTNPTSIQAQQKQQSVTTPGGSFKIIVQVNEVNNDKHDKMILVTSDPSFNPLKVMLSSLIHYDSSKVGISSPYRTTFDLPKDTVKTGEKFMACLLSLQPFQTPTYKEPIICKTGINSPASKPEIVIFSTSELLSSSSSGVK